MVRQMCSTTSAQASQRREKLFGLDIPATAEPSSDMANHEFVVFFVQIFVHEIGLYIKNSFCFLSDSSLQMNLYSL